MCKQDRRELERLRRELAEVQQRLDVVDKEVQRLRILTTPIYASTAKWKLPPGVLL